LTSVKGSDKELWWSMVLKAALCRCLLHS